MTADLYATAAGLIERSAAAYVSGVPEGAGDDGFFGPASVAWRVSADLASPVAGLRSLLMQALHPLAMAGVDQHSGWRRDPVGRLAATSAYLATVTFGERAVAEQAAARVRRIHDHVRGTDAVTGRPYAAGDPALLLWVHGALVDSVLTAGSQLGTALSAADMIVDAPHPGRGVHGRGPVAEGDRGEVCHGNGEPADRIPAPAAVLIDTGHRQRMQRLQQQGPQARHRRGQVSAHPPGDAGGPEKAVVSGAFRHTQRERSRRALDKAGVERGVSQANQLLISRRRNAPLSHRHRPVEPGRVFSIALGRLIY